MEKTSLIRMSSMLCLLFASGWLYASPPENPSGGRLVVHEWGTFLCVQGSDGATLGGMVDSDEVLPDFVDSRGFASWQRARFGTKMETPVTYFYTDRPQTVQVRVEMPGGLLTHWFPAVCIYGPKPGTEAKTAKSFLDWCQVQLIPDRSPASAEALKAAAGIKSVGRDQVWRFARATDSAIVRKETHDAKGKPEDQFEKFLFYRGLGTFTLPLSVRTDESSKAGLRLELTNKHHAPLQSAFLVRVTGDTIQFGAIGDLAGKEIKEVSAESTLGVPLSLDAGVPRVKTAVAETLTSAGLYPKEATGMVNTWEKSYFRTEGLRVLYILPREMVDDVIPIQIKPAPDRLVRIMVGRTEVLTPSREQEIEKMLGRLGADDFQVRETATSELARLGRIGEPALRRVRTKTTDPEIRARADALIGRLAAGN
jgi:hypothetical protein